MSSKDGSNEQAHRVGGLFEAGDGLRGMALLCIIVFHAAAPIAANRGGHIGDELNWAKAFGTGKGDILRSLELWVYLFFSLSAFLLSRPFIAWIAGRRPRPDVGTFFKRRVFRIVPMFWATGIFVLIKYGRLGSSWGDVVHFFAFLQVYFPSSFATPVEHGWSIDDEWLFYFLLPLVAFASAAIFARVQDRRAAFAWSSVLVLGVVVAGVLLRRAGMENGSPLVQSPPGLLRAFLPGIVMAVFEIVYSDRLRGNASVRRIGGIASAIGIVLIFVVFRIDGVAANTQASVWLGSLIGGLVVGGALLVQIGGNGAVWWLWGNPVIRWYGERSYSIFLLHGVALFELRKVATHGSSNVAVVIYSAIAIAVLTVVGYFTYRFIEKPFMDYSHRGQRRKVEPLPSAS